MGDQCHELVGNIPAQTTTVWLLRLLNELKQWQPGPILLYNDNVIALRNGEYHQKTKKIETKYYYVRDQQEPGKIDTKYIPSEEQLDADLFTKALP